MAKSKKTKIDGLSADDIEKIRKAIRQVWSWSHPRRLVVKRCLLPNGFSKCEGCKKRVPKIFVDHISKVGKVDGGFIERLFTPSHNLQGLCMRCHKEKTNLEKKQDKKFSIDNCIEKNCLRARGYGRRFHCEAHYYRLRRNGILGNAPIKKIEKHGQTASPEYRAWAQMWIRCTKITHPRYKYYGARGITVAEEWRSFITFLKDMGKRPGLKYSLDRIDNNEGYTAKNCRWATHSEQMKNRRRFKKGVTDEDFF